MTESGRELDVADATTWPELLTTKQVAAILQVNVATVQAMLREGQLCHVTFGARNVRVQKSNLIAESARTSADLPVA